MISRIREFLPVFMPILGGVMWLIHTEMQTGLAPVKQDISRISAGVEFLARNSYTTEQRINELTNRLDTMTGPVIERGKYVRQ